MLISVFNTKSKTKEEFIPLSPGKVVMYHCGPTVYNFQHIGNMRRFIFADILHRMFLSNQYSVSQVINITDVGHMVSDEDEGEDKMEKGAKREGKSPKEISDIYTSDFLEDLKLLNIHTENTLFPRATENIPEQIELITSLEEKGFTYQISTGIYFDTSKYTYYDKFAKLNLENLMEGARVNINTEKKNPTDFALWKFSPKEEQRQQEWESPWGVGFPGWHIECSAMILKFLGKTIDIHTGGIDHIPVHHTNEIAQSENANGVPLSNYWMHNEHLNFNYGKMAKSGDSFIRLKDLIEKGYSPLAYRYFVLLANYRSKINFTYEGLDAATVAWTKLNEFITKTPIVKNLNEEYLEKAQEALNDDLDTPKIISIIWEIMKDLSIDDSVKKSTILEIDKMLGVIDSTFQINEEILYEDLPKKIKDLINKRNKARHEKNWKEADILREKLQDLGYLIKDTNDRATIIQINPTKNPPITSLK